MILWLVLRRLLPLLAVLSLALAPVTASAAAAAMHAPRASEAHPMAMAHADPMAGTAVHDPHRHDPHMHDSHVAGSHMSGSHMHDPDMGNLAMADMPCCPHERPAMPDCSKGCPLMALCLAKLAAGLPGGVGLPVRVAVVQGTAWTGEASFASLNQAPSPEPPRS